MSAYPAWTPASRPGIVPLHPLSFGTILGRSFVALRQNPRVLLGFALVVQTLAYIVILVAIGGVTFAAFSRLDTVVPGSEDFETVLAGSIALVAVVSFVLGIAAGALSVIVQGVVVIEVTRAVVAEKRTLREIWRQVKPSAWRLIGYSALIILVVIAALAIVTAGLFVIGTLAVPVAIFLAVLLVISAIPLVWWLTIKLLLVPSVILVERATIGSALRRSWRLTRGRFWVSLGVILLISVAFSAIGQVISIPFSFVTTGLTTIIAPTGEIDTSGIIAMLVSILALYALILVIQSIAVVVQSSATALIYVDCRMRKEGLDLDLLEYVEKRDSGAADLPDPYVVHIGRDLEARFAAPAYPPPGYGQPRYPAPSYPPQSYAPQPPQPGYAPQPPQPAAPPATVPEPPHAPPAPTQWAAPGSDREPPRQ